MSEWGRKREVMLHYDQTVASYDAQYADEQTTKIRVALKNARLKENSLVLDMGCGTGLLFPYVADKAKLLIGIDISRKLLKQAQKRAKRHPNVILIQTDADYTPFKNQTFHNLFAITLLQNMPNPKTTLKEIGRVTKPEATIILTTLKKRFTQKIIPELLRKARLKITALKTTAEMKDHIIICRKQAVHSETRQRPTADGAHTHITLKSTHSNY